MQSGLHVLPKNVYFPMKQVSLVFSSKKAFARYETYQKCRILFSYNGGYVESYLHAWNFFSKMLKHVEANWIYAEFFFRYLRSKAEVWVTEAISPAKFQKLDWLTDWLIAKLLLALASIVILGSESHGTRGHILLSDGSGILQTWSPSEIRSSQNFLFFLSWHSVQTL
jgi:hypothetical protein